LGRGACACLLADVAASLPCAAAAAAWPPCAVAAAAVAAAGTAAAAVAAAAVGHKGKGQRVAAAAAGPSVLDGGMVVSMCICVCVRVRAHMHMIASSAASTMPTIEIRGRVHQTSYNPSLQE